MGWSGKIRVNGTTYKWMGADGAGIAANVTNVQITPTRSIFVMQAGPMNVTVTYLSPVEVRGFPFRNGILRVSTCERTLSPTTGSSSPSRSPTYRWKPSPSTATAILYKYTPISVQVRFGVCPESQTTH